MNTEPTIFAVSTAPGRSGIAVIRVSGPVAGKALRALGGSLDRPRQAGLVSLVDPGTSERLDRALTLWFAGPASFTGEDVAEFHIHGGRAVVAAVVDALGQMPGLEAAAPGGFTRQAFANGKLDLTEVEGLADLIGAETEAQRRMALRQMEGGLSDIYEAWRRELVGLMAHVEADIDFADEDVPQDLTRSAMGGMEALAVAMTRHLNDDKRGERLRAGFRIVLAGPPNAGKSSLLNALARRDVAIVSPEPGTTRDLIDVALDLGGYPVEVTDTAGIRDTEGAIEKEGVRRALTRADNADLVLWLRPADRADAPAAPRDLQGDVLDVVTKCDLATGPADGLGVSIVSGAGLETLIDILQSRAEAGLAGSEDAVITRSRHRRSVGRARDALLGAISARTSGAEFVAENLRVAASELGRLTGRVDVEDLLDVIFADFCIGK
ncbi:tRNA-5-carboxymethylaminomethyl-2-thiouridine(34)synthesis protein MnmE [hydrothermal vent metagenome]|uniref:tRNA-5-carboxymethylaminomethyl-2-thiouridine(34) synthesis protein MnmE n=1 Tax=hydrothermal vent metagenome TaxID=652676 RepID=A0A3B0TRT8_9ZZZZ